MYRPRLSVILGNVGSCSDRYMTRGYSDSFTTEQLFERVASIESVTGVELVGNWHISAKNVKEIQTLLSQTKKELVSIIPDNFGLQKWGKGAYSSKDSGIRREAVEETKEMMDICALLGGNLLSLWPGQDGYDYLFTADYGKERTWFEESIAECAKHRRDIRISIEYKPKEPRVRSYPSNVYSTLLMVKEIGDENVGVTLDYGHSTAAYENVAESIAVLHKYDNKLFHMHMNDNYCLWDDDMIVGSVHTIAYIEMFYWLKRTNYQGYISTDQYPYREDSRAAVEESVKWMNAYLNLVNRMDVERTEDIITSGDAVKMSRYMRELLFERDVK